MKRVLITGAGSYVGTHVMRRLQEEPEEFEVQELDVKGDAWKAFDFSCFDSVFHVAGIAHVSTDLSMEPLYMQVNRDLTIDVAKHAKEAGVKQFIFMSSSIVYGDSTVEDRGPITLETKPNPANFYGRSKLEAEEGLKGLSSDDFSVAILRCPMIYGPGCKGNFPLLAKMARTLPFFPALSNCRSVLYVGNLAEFVAKIVECGDGGIYFPQNKEYMSTSQTVFLLAKGQDKGIHLSCALAPFARFACGRVDAAKKAFGNLYYDMSISKYGFDYQTISFEESIKRYCKDLGENA